VGRGGSEICQFHVIDGQHRLIALAALLAVGRDLETERGNHVKAEEVQRTYLCHRSCPLEWCRSCG
jgi:hypothetical protein